MLILIVRPNQNLPLEEGSRYIVKHSKEAALLFTGIKTSAPNPDQLLANLYDVNLQGKTITEIQLPKVVFAVD